MLDDIGLRAARGHWGLLRRDAGEVAEAAGRAVFWARLLVRSSPCLVGRHRWLPWEAALTPFTEREGRRCRRCSGREWRGGFPGYTIRVEAGTLRPTDPRDPEFRI